MPSHPLHSDPSAMLERGARIGKYEILTLLSVGGMAEVFLASASGPGGFRKLVTLKRILPTIAVDEAFVQMFINEAQISASLSHSNIAQVFDLGQDDGELYLAMEFVPGMDLRKINKASQARGRPVPIGFSCAVIRDLCTALHYAHHFTEAGGAPAPIIHRDVSPKNVMVSYQGNIKVIDFGIARAIGATAEGPEQVQGTASYMSPEQVNGLELDGRSDLFSAGIILYELLAGRPLFRAATDLLTFAQVLNGPIPSLTEANPAVSEELAGVVKKALSRSKEDRYATGRAMARALDHAASDLIFDEDHIAGTMRFLFEDHLLKTRELLGRGKDTTTDGLRAAARALGDFPATESSSPAQEAEDATPRLLIASDAVTRTASTAGPGANTVLVVDDSRTGVAQIRRCLEPAGYRVVGCTDPTQALSVLEKEQPDLVILDVIMPVLDGFALCSQIRERASSVNLPILFVSAACSLEERAKGLMVGGDDFIRKPFDPEEFVVRVRTQLHRVSLLQTERSSVVGS